MRRSSAWAPSFALATSVAMAAAPIHAAHARWNDAPEVSPEVEEINDRAIEKFKNKDYDEAIELFKQAYDLHPEPNYLFNIGRVYEQKGDLKNAVDYYGQFVRLPEIDLKSREIALERLRVLTGVLDETEPGWDKPEGADEPEPVPTEPTSTEPTDTTPTKRKPNPMRIAGYSLIGVGGAALIAGAAFAGVAKGNENDLAALTTLEDRDAQIKTGKRNAIVADAMFATGGVLAVVGIVLVIVSLKKKPNAAAARTRIVPAVGARGGGVTAVLRF